jgi:DNA-binding transcriptional LysR family regulator
MNVHHLELFFYVAKHGGITSAVRRIPYGIQQPAVSKQIVQLEEFLGVSLFQRRPFKLTAEGAKLFAFIQPFFSNLDSVALELQGGESRTIRIGASVIVLRDHMPSLLQAVRKKFSKLKVSLREGYQPELENLLLRDEIDLAITLVEKKSPTGIQALPLLELPLVLLVEKSSRFTDAEQLWKLDRIAEPLIALPAFEVVYKNFQQELGRKGVEWFTSIEVSSLDLVEKYVAGGLGIGLSVSIPGLEFSPKLRAIPLPGFEPLSLGVLRGQRVTPVAEALIEELKTRANGLRGKPSK